MRRARYPVSRVDELQDGVGRTVKLGVQGECTLFRRGDTCVAVGSLCPHQNAPLEGATIEDGRIVCKRHGYRFDPDSGDCVTAAGYGLPIFGVEIVDGTVYVSCWEFD